VSSGRSGAWPCDGGGDGVADGADGVMAAGGAVAWPGAAARYPRRGWPAPPRVPEVTDVGRFATRRGTAPHPAENRSTVLLREAASPVAASPIFYSTFSYSTRVSSPRRISRAAGPGSSDVEESAVASIG
jgi:hypothetical protein